MNNVLNFLSTNLQGICWLITTVGFLFFFLLKYELSPGLHLRLQAVWIDEMRIVLHIEVENKSKVAVMKQSVKLQIDEHLANTKNITEWVAFEPVKVHAGEDPVDPVKRHDRIDLFQSNKRINQGEVLTIERLVTLSSKDHLFQVGLQFKSKSVLPWLRLHVLGHNEQWTTTAIFVPPKGAAGTAAKT